MRAMILCAGYGTRLGELTRELPKPMLLLEGHPLLEYIIVNLARQGICEIAVNLHFLPELIRNYFDSGSKWNVQIHYSYEPVMLGTAGGLKHMEDFLRQGECFLAHYGDILHNQSLSPMVEFHNSRNAIVTMLVHHRPGSNSVVSMDHEGRVTDFLERPNEDQRQTTASSWVNSGVFVCSPDFLNMIPAQGASDIPKDILPALIPSRRVYAYPLSGYRCAIDSPERLAQASKDIAAGRYLDVHALD
jgi:NDP-sugar pyrophosphorylase family protein